MHWVSIIQFERHANKEAADYIGLKSQVTKVKIKRARYPSTTVLIEIDNSWKVLTKSADGSSLLHDPATQLDQQSELSRRVVNYRCTR